MHLLDFSHSSLKKNNAGNPEFLRYQLLLELSIYIIKNQFKIV